MTGKKKNKKIKKRVLEKKEPKRIPDDTIHQIKVRVIGIGGGGGSIVSEIVSRIRKADFVAANTDSRALKAAGNVKKFQFGQSLTKGLGTGMNPQVGELAAQNDKEKIKKLFEGQDFCVIVASLGGGTGAGATPVFAKLSKSLGCLTYGIFTFPFEFEGEKKMEIAREALLKIKPYLNIYSIIPNEGIFKVIDKNTPLKDALSSINKRLADNLGGLLEMIYSPGLINIDFADLRTILSGYGKLAYLNTTESGEENDGEAVQKLVSSPLYTYSIKGTRGILYNIIGGDKLQLSDVSQISNVISRLANKEAKIIFGINQSRKNLGRVKITLLAVGCATKGVLPGNQPKKKQLFSSPAAKPISKRIKKQRTVAEKRKKIKKRKKRKLARNLEIKESPKAEVLIPVAPEVVSYSDGGKIRRNALQLKKVMEEEEKEMLEQEKILETPAILRKKEES